MTHTPHDITNVERHLEESRSLPLAPHERDALWLRIEPVLAGVRGVPSPFVFLGMRSRSLVASAMALVMIVSVGGTAVASESARPGDFLFPVDRALEDARLLLAVSDDSHSELVDAFAAERITELDDIVHEEQQKSATTGAPLSDDSRQRIESALGDVAQFLEVAGVDSSSAISGFTEVSKRDDEEQRLEGRTQSLRTESQDDSNERVEYRDEEVRIHTIIKDGEVRTRVEFEDDHKSDDDDSDDRNDSDDRDDSEDDDSDDDSRHDGTRSSNPSSDDSDERADDDDSDRDSSNDVDDDHRNDGSADDRDSHSGSGSGDDDTVDD
ncbi:MAG: hypothetical protein RLZZ234_803 [Candidatus Parcubacteria bacterium]